jgi:hypothetical protein
VSFRGTQLVGRQDPLALFDALAADLAARGLLTPQQGQHARAYVSGGHLASSALIAVGAPAEHVIRALSTLTGFAPAPPRAEWKLDARNQLSVDPSVWAQLGAIPVDFMDRRPLIAFANPFLATSSVALALPDHIPCVATEDDVREALQASPSGAKGAVSFLAPPSAVTQAMAANTSAAFAPGTTPQLAGTMAGPAPNSTPAPGAPVPHAQPGPNLPSYVPPQQGHITAQAPPNMIAPTQPGAPPPGLQPTGVGVPPVTNVGATMVMGGAGSTGLPTPSPNVGGGTLVMGGATPTLPARPAPPQAGTGTLVAGTIPGPSAPQQAPPTFSPPAFAGGEPSQLPPSAPFTTPGAPAQAAPAQPAPAQPAPAQPAPAQTADVNANPNVTQLSSGEVIGPGLRCGKYFLESKLGEGGMAIVFAGTPIDGQGPKAAVKVIHEHLLRSAQGEDLRRRFEREVKAMQQLQHPNIVACLDAGRIGSTEYLSTEFIGGGSLQDLLARTGRLPPMLALSFFGDLLDGLQHAHDRGIVHRDLKPDNLLLDTDGVMKVADFGIARMAEGTQLTATGGIIGTPSYMSPEQALAEPLDTRTDLYSSGVILYELLTGRNPFVDSSVMATLANVISGNYRRIGEVEASVPFLVDVVLARMMATRPDDRYATAAAVKKALAPVLERAKAYRASWKALVNQEEGALQAAFNREADALAAEAKGLQSSAPLRAGFAAYRAARLSADHAGAQTVLKSLGNAQPPMRFARSADPGFRLRENEVAKLTGDKLRAELRDLAEDYLKDNNPLLAANHLRRSVADFGLQKEERKFVEQVISPDEIDDLSGIQERTGDAGPASEAKTVADRAWKPPAQQKKAEAAARDEPSSSSGGVPMYLKAAIVIAATAIPLAVILYFLRG